MKRKFLIAAIVSFFIAGLAAYGLCSSETTNLGLTKPTKGDRNWGRTVNNNMDLLDAAYGNYVTTSDDLPQVYVYSNTFNSTTGRTITLPNEVDAVTEYSVTVTPTTRAGAIGDIYMTKTTTNFVVKCSEANTTDTFAAVVYYIGDVSNYGGSIYRRWYVSPDSSITDHGNASTTGSLAWVAAQIGASPAVIEAPGNKNYQIKQNLTLADNISYQPQPGAIIDTDISIRDSNYEWYQNGATSEYYLQASGGGNPNINMPSVAIENSVWMTAGAAGSLAAGEWNWNDVNGLGYSTVYVRLTDSTDPDGKSADYVEAGYTLAINGRISMDLLQKFSGEGKFIFDAGIIKTIHPQWWGAVGDGSADDMKKIQAAINSMPSDSTLHITGGEYMIGAGLTVTAKTRITIKGDGVCSRIHASAATFDLLTITNSEDVTIQNLSFEGASSATEGLYGIWITDSPRMRIQNCKFTGTNKGVGMDGSADECIIQNNHFLNLVGATSGNGYGVFTTTDRNVISGNTFNNVPRHDVYLSGSAGAQGARYNVVEGNTSIDSGADAISLYSQATQQSVIGNVIKGNTIIDPVIGISLNQQALNNIVHGNYISGASGASVYVNGGVIANTYPNFNSIVGNVIVSSTATTGGIELANGSYNVIANNTLNSPGTYGIYGYQSGSPTTPPAMNMVLGNVINGASTRDLQFSDANMTDTRIADNIYATMVATSTRAIASGNMDGSVTGFAIGAGTGITKHIACSTIQDWSNIVDGAMSTKTVTCVGANEGDVVAVGFTTRESSTPSYGWSISAECIVDDAVEVTIVNHTGGAVDLDSATLRVDVWQH